MNWPRPRGKGLGRARRVGGDGTSNVLLGIVVVLGLGAMVVLATVAIRAVGGGGEGEAPIITCESQEMLGDYAANEIAADQRYKGRVVDVVGRVEDVHRDIANRAYVTFAAPGIRRVQCFFPREAEPSLTQLASGWSVTIRGRCDGLMINVLLRDCRVISSNPPAEPHVVYPGRAPAAPECKESF